MELSRYEKIILDKLKSINKASISELEKLCLLSSDELMSAASWLQYKNLITIIDKKENFYELTKIGKDYLYNYLPERNLLFSLKSTNCVEDILKKISKSELTIALSNLCKYGVKLESKKIVVDDLNKLDSIINEKENLLKIFTEKVSENKLDSEIIQEFKHRKIIEKYVMSNKILEITSKGLEIANNLVIEDKIITQLTPELIISGKALDAKFSKYSLETYVPKISASKEHLITTLSNQIRDIFVGMGFEEVDYDYIQTCFWNMDALFVPQDHPARDLQDSFYIDKEYEISSEHVKKVKLMHEKYWNYKWCIDEAKKTILRTHTTVNSIRYLSENFNKRTIKIFSISRNFRRERMDSAHLPEFTQIEGIVVEKNANFNMLIGILKEFYKKIGFEKISFRPSYFPFTEPSLEVIVYNNEKPFELGGAGIFRKEITKCFNIKYNVLAWGLGLERLMMIKYNISDIRDIF